MPTLIVCGQSHRMILQELHWRGSSVMPLSVPEDVELLSLLDRHQGGDEHARDRLVGLACQRMERRASRMLRTFPEVARWDETGDILHGAMMRLQRALPRMEIRSVRHWWWVCGEMIRRELLDLARRYRGPHGLGANHHTDGHGAAADDPGQPLAAYSGEDGEPQTLSAWAELYEQVEALPDDLREAFHLLAFEGMSQEEAASLLDVDVRTIKRRWQRAKLALREAREGRG